MAHFPFLVDELFAVWEQLETDPRGAGFFRVPISDDEREHWRYIGPRLANRPRLRLFWTIKGNTIFLASLRVIWPEAMS